MFFWRDVGFQCARVSAQKNTTKFRKPTVLVPGCWPMHRRWGAKWWLYSRSLYIRHYIYYTIYTILYYTILYYAMLCYAILDYTIIYYAVKAARLSKRRGHVRKHGIGGEVRHGVTSGVSRETSSNKQVTAHLHRECIRILRYPQQISKACWKVDRCHPHTFIRALICIGGCFICEQSAGISNSEKNSSGSVGEQIHSNFESPTFVPPIKPPPRC